MNKTKNHKLFLKNSLLGFSLGNQGDANFQVGQQKYVISAALYIKIAMPLFSSSINWPKSLTLAPGHPTIAPWLN